MTQSVTAASPVVTVAPRLFCALDTTDLTQARHWAHQLTGTVDGLKVGLEFFCANGPAGVRAIRDIGLPVFLDLKLHDIPNTVAGAMRAAAALGVSLITVHASGGEAMLRAAVDAAADGAARAGLTPPAVIGITVMTSLADSDLDAIGQRGPAVEQVERLARLSQASGLAGVVSSAREVAMLRHRLNGSDAASRLHLVVPGIRPSWADAQDQKRIVTPAEAVRLGADSLVIGRPITAAADPAAAARRVRDEIEAAVAAAAQS